MRPAHSAISIASSAERAAACTTSRSQASIASCSFLKRNVLRRSARSLASVAKREYGRLAHPPATFAQERLKIEQRLPAVQKFIAEQKLNELIAGEIGEIGIIVLGGP